MERRGLYWTAKKIYQTKDQLVSKNLMTDVENGDIIKVNNEITPIANEERNLAAFRNVYDTWDKNRREKTMTFEAVSGETLPSATPFRLGFIQQRAAAGHFDFQREDIGLMLKKFILEVIVPTFKNSSRNKHLFNFYGEDNEFSQMEDFLIEQMLYTQIQQVYQTSGKIPTADEVTLERENAKMKLRSKPNRIIDIPEGYYQDLKYRMDLIVTDEQVNIDSKVTTLTTAMQTIATNPMILQNPVTKRILLRLLELGGVNPEELGDLSTLTQPPQQMMQQPLSPPPGPGSSKGEVNMSPRNMQI